MKNIIIVGGPGVGKSTTLDVLQKKIPPNERLVTDDLARHYMQSRNLKADEMKDEEKAKMQLQVIAGYIGSIKEATHAKVMALIDGGLITAYPYCENVLSESTMNRVVDKLLDYPQHSIAYVIPPTIPLVNDGLRHTDKEFRIYIHKRIMEVIEAFGIPYQYVMSQGVEDRADEILSIHNQQQLWQK